MKTFRNPDLKKSQMTAEDEAIEADLALSLSPKEKRVLEFIEVYIKKTGSSPTFTEIQEKFEFASINSVQNYIKQLTQKNYIRVPGHNLKRAIQVIRSASSFKDSLPANLQGSVSKERNVDRKYLEDDDVVPLLGKVAAGLPIESYSHDESIHAPKSLLQHRRADFALKVVGNSMIEDGILNGDTLFIAEPKGLPANGAIVIAVINDVEATVKRIYWRGEGKNRKLDQVELRPSNSSMTSLYYNINEVAIRGEVIGLLRSY